MMLNYTLPDNLGQIIITDEVLQHFDKSRQVGFLSRERGGQMFCRFDGSTAIIERVTGPRRNDRRGRYFFIPDRKTEQSEINSLYREGLHYIGDWHTHAEGVPSPSQSDINSMHEIVTKSRHELTGLLMVIIGHAPFPDGLHISLHNRHTMEFITLTAAST